ncbi:MAG: hypothetical protein ABR511_03355, partial [Acidimicrobiales bacterium]
GGTFYGGDGNDTVVTLSGGTFYGEAGDDYVSGVNGTGVFLGGEGNEIVSNVYEQGLFCGGPGVDDVDMLSLFQSPPGTPNPLAGGTFYGEEGDDFVNFLLPGGTFIQDGTCPVAYVPPPVSP